MINNILSYFIKDIKDPKELAFYKSFNTTAYLEIFYKDELLYKMTFIPFNYCYNYKKNILKNFFLHCNYKLYSNKRCKHKYLYYKNNNKISIANPDPDYIWYSYNQTKYLKKISISYKSNNKYLLNIKLLYHKGSKYIFRFTKNSIIFNQSLILIMNKYELHYYNIFVYLYFDWLDY